MKHSLPIAVALVCVFPVCTHALDPDFQLLKSLGIQPNGPALLKYFKDRTITPDPKVMSRLIRQLGDESFRERESAQKELVNVGPAGLATLKLAENDPDPEIRVRVEKVRAVVMAKAEPAVEAAAARLLAAIRPPGTAEVLLNYLPAAGDQDAATEMVSAIKATAIRDGKSESVVVKALEDPLADKRIAAAEALVADKGQLPKIRKLMQDADPQVRLHVALALVGVREKDAIPVLIDLLGVLHANQLWQVEEVLFSLAGNNAPEIPLGDSDAARKKCREAWGAWYTRNAAKVDLAKVGEVKTVMGYTLVCQQQLGRFVAGKRVPAIGCVMELDKDKKQRWRFELNTYPVDAQVLRHGRVLVAEYQGGRITERDFTGKVLWEQNVGGNPISVQGLPNGNVFVVTRNRLVEYDRAHKEVFSRNTGFSIFRARKLRNGDVVFVSNTGQVTRIDSSQKALKTFQVNNVQILFGSIDVLPGGGLLVPEFQQNRVAEYDANGKLVGQFPMQWPNSAMRLPNGHTLVGSQNTRRVIEFNSRGQEVWSFTTDGTLFNTRKR